MSIVVGSPAVAPGAARGVCTAWATTADLCAPCTDPAMDQALLARCLEAASGVLFHLSGRQFPGLCSDVVRPCARSVRVDHGRPIRGEFWPFGAGVGWSSGPWQGAASAWGWCLCNQTERSGYAVPEVALPGPVDSVQHVMLDGVELVSGVDYRVDDGRYLVRLPDPATGAARGWPCCQDVTLSDTQPGTFSVAYTRGVMPPPQGVLACADLGCQLALAFSPQRAGECKLPQRVTSLTRQGMTAVVLDPMAFIDKGKTGLYLVDLFLSSVNPKGIQRAATVWHPDMGGRSVRRTGTA